MSLNSGFDFFPVRLYFYYNSQKVAFLSGKDEKKKAYNNTCWDFTKRIFCFIRKTLFSDQLINSRIR